MIVPRFVWLILLPLSVGLLVSGCSSVGVTPPSRYAMSKDAGPDGHFDAESLPDPVPRYEARSRSGNKSPYVVWGKTYHIMPSASGYTQTGIASWYGAKFHGYDTASGEPYDMYALTAAHKSLPLPTWVRVTNLDNGRTTVVKVNDRGPFHDGRIIDLSYAAAMKLGYAGKGTARVSVEAIEVAPPTALAGSPAARGTPVSGSANPELVVQSTDLSPGHAYFIQAGAFAQRESADRLVARLSAQGIQPKAFVHNLPEQGKTAQRVRLGPYYSKSLADSEQQKLQKMGIKSAIVIMRPVVAETQTPSSPSNNAPTRQKGQEPGLAG